MKKVLFLLSPSTDLRQHALWSQEFRSKRTRSDRAEPPADRSPPLPQNEAETMLGRSAATAARVAARSQPKGQKRTFIDYLTNYPDRVSTIVSVSPERRPLVSRYRWCLRTGFYAELRTRPTDLIGLNPRWCVLVGGSEANGFVWQ